MQGLGFLEGGFSSTATDVSADGSVVVGSGITYGLGTEAFRWTESGGMQRLGDLGGTTPSWLVSAAYGVNNDGSVVVGQAWSPNGAEAFRWTQSGGMQGLGDLDGGDFRSLANAVNLDGTVIVGESYSGENREAFRWTATDGMQGLGFLEEGNFWSKATDVSADGSVVVGYGTGTNGVQAFRWTEAGGMQGLGDFEEDSFNSRAFGTSADGSVIVGYGFVTSKGGEAFRWTEATGLQTIPQWLAENGVSVGEGFRLFSATDVSDDGTVVVGEGGHVVGTGEAYGYDYGVFLARAGSGAISLNDLAQGLAETGSSTLVSIGAVGTVLNGAHSQPLSYRVSPGQHCGWIAGDWGVDNHGSRDGGMALAEIGGCHHFGQVQTNMAIGKTWGNQNLALNGDIDHDGNYIMAEALLPVSQFARGELWAALSALYQWGDTDITRGYLNAGLPDSSHGNPDSRAWALRARLEWDTAVQLGAIAISPYADLSHMEARVDGYTETGGGFPATFNSSRDEVTGLRLGANANKPIDGSTNIVGLLEAAHQFSSDGINVSGTVIGLSSFNFEVPNTKDTWLRAGIGIDKQTEKGKASFMLNGTTEGGAPTAWIAASWQTTF